MRRLALTGMALFTATMVLGMELGCRPKSPPSNGSLSSSGDAELVQQLRQSYQRIHPGTRVGLVTAVAEDVSLAAVGDIDLKSFSNGDILTFIDPNEKPVANGTVVNITPDALHVKYAPLPDGRIPRQGDLAVSLRNP
ncbi:MAG: hypothetical protein IT446_01390 [Phycisphaerales bacterium]|nr:hypothetical protein [Phycisphaerales bacterium]